MIVKANIKGIPARKVYLTDAFKWQIFLDSASYNNDTFTFNLNSNIEPFLASICFIDSIGNIKTLAYQNNILSDKDHKYAETAFFLDEGTTTIKGTYNFHPTINSDKLLLNGSKQNEPMFKTMFSNFGWINTKDTLQRKNIIDSYKSLIRQYPYSYYFVLWLYNYRTQYSSKELNSMLSLFNNEAKQYSYYNKILQYFQKLPKPGMPLHNYVCNDSSDNSKEIIGNVSKINLIIFWASWCKPCRDEIPELKKINNEFKNKGVSIVSISIDEDKTEWKKALIQEKMDWEQLIINNKMLTEIQNSFNFSSIPLVILADKNGLELRRFSGNDSSNYSDLISAIRKNL